MNIHVFDVDKLSRRVFDGTWPLLASKSAKNDSKMAPQNDPKSTKNRDQKMIKILIASKRPTVRSRGPSGGLRGALGGNIRGVMICQRCLKFEKLLTCRLNLDLERPIETKKPKNGKTSGI